MSAAARKATIARKQQQKEGQSTVLTHRAKKQRSEVTNSDKNPKERTDSSGRIHNENSSTEVVVYVSSLLGGLWSTVDRPDMAFKSMKTLLLDAFTNDTVLFQSALFVAGTHSNTCGMSASALHGFGSGLLMLRGASLNAIQASVVAGDGDGMTSVAIALLAGWERRFGDRESYEVHIEAWKKMSLPAGALETNNISTLADLTLESFRQGLNERTLSGSVSLPLRSSGGRIHLPVGLPPGFMVLHADRPEAMSLLHLVVMINNHEPSAPNALKEIRKMSLENIAWAPNHSVACDPMPAYEDAWDQTELNALYHIRAACVSINGILIEATQQAHGVKWTFDLQAGLDIHATACQHLSSEELMGTRYEEVALWARFTIAAISTERYNSDTLRSLLMRRGIQTWDELKSLLQRHVYPELYFGTKYYNLYRELMDDWKRIELVSD